MSEDLEDGGNAGPITLTEEEMEAVDELRHLRSERADIADREKVLRAEILQRLGDADRAMTASGAPAVKLRRQVRRSVDGKALEALYPDIYAEVMSESDVIVLDLP